MRPIYTDRKHDSNVPEGLAQMIYKQVDACLREITKKEHELIFDEKLTDGTPLIYPVTYRMAKENCRVRITKKGQVSNGGFHGIKIDAYLIDFPRAFHREYPRIAKDPVIGDTPMIGPELVIFCIVAHEVAHHIQRRWAMHTRIYSNGHRKPHGQVWQDIYRILRSRVVNPLIDEQLAERRAA